MISNLNIDLPAFIPSLVLGQAQSVTAADLQNLQISAVCVSAFDLLLRPGLIVLQNQKLNNFSAQAAPVFCKVLNENFIACLKQITETGVFCRSPQDGSTFFVNEQTLLDILLAISPQFILGIDLDIAYQVASPKKALLLKKLFIHWNAFLAEKQITKLFFHDLPCLPENAREAELLLKEEHAAYVLKPSNVQLILAAKSIKMVQNVQSLSEMYHCLENKADLIESPAPVLAAKQALLFSANEILDLKDEKYAFDTHSIEENCACYTCQNFTLSYLHHLYQAQESFGLHLNTIHNLYFYQKRMKDLRSSSEQGKLHYFNESFRQ